MVIDAETGEHLNCLYQRNLVVDLGKKNIARLLGGHPSGGAITKISVGEGINPPSRTDSALTNPFTKNVDSVSYPSGNQVQFAFSLSANEANGMNISELALITSGNTMFSRKSRAPIAKDPSVIITGLWTITIN